MMRLNRPARHLAATVPAMLLVMVSLAHAQAGAATDLRGAWDAERYEMASGPVHEVRGRILFTDRDWQVLFFVLDEAGRVRRGSGEGGSYELRPGGLVFTHLFNLSVGDALPGLPAAELRMVARSPGEAPTEPTDVRVEGEVLTLFFPSGNRMIFRRR